MATARSNFSSSLGTRARIAAVQRFYDPATPAAERALLLERACATHVALPSGGALPLGGATPFRPSFVVSGPSGEIVVWSRHPPAGC